MGWGFGSSHQHKMKTIQIKIIKSTKDLTKGRILTVGTATAEKLISEGIAEQYYSDKMMRSK